MPQALLIIEILSVLLTLAYIYFAAKKNAIAWIFGIFASLLSVYLFFHKELYGSAILNIVYGLQGVIGFVVWKNINADKNPSYELKWFWHLSWMVLCSIVAFIVYKCFIFMNYEAVLYIDMLLACTCILATGLEIRKDTSCWWYWIICNLGYAALYIWQSLRCEESLYVYSLLMLVLAVFSFIGLREWSKGRGKYEVRGTKDEGAI